MSRLEPGRLGSFQIATRVMGWKPRFMVPGSPLKEDGPLETLVVYLKADGDGISPYAWNPQEKMSDAWQVWQHCRDRYGDLAFAAALRGLWGITNADPADLAVGLLVKFLAPLAICQAALALAGEGAAPDAL